MAVDQAHDELLVLRSQDGDRRALEELVGRWQGRFVRTAARLTGQPEAARDAVQEAWLVIVRGLGRLDDPARFGPWAYRIVRADRSSEGPPCNADPPWNAYLNIRFFQDTVKA